MPTLAEIRAKLQAQENKTNNNGGGDNAIFPFWNLNTEDSATVRFLPDADENNDFFWVEKQTIRIPFAGIKGHDENKEINVQVPCADMYDGLRCPIQAETKEWWNDPQMEDLARTYWKKRTYLMQGFVVSSDLKEENTPENPIRRFSVTTQIFNPLRNALMDPDFGDDLPTDYENGTDFRIIKGKKGQWADYSGSNWARKTRALTEDERAAVEEYGLNNLSDFLPKRPSEDDLRVIFEMFEASVDGQLYDPERWASHYKPWGFNYEGGSKAEQPKAEAPKQDAPKEEPKAEKAKEEAPKEEASKSSANDILAQIRSRKSA